MALHIKRRVVLDLRRQGAQVSIPFVKGDRVAHEIVFTIRDNAEIVELPPGTLAAITIRNGSNDGAGVVDFCAIDHVENTISYIPTEAALAVAGNVYCDLHIFNSDGASIGSPFFIFQIADTQATEAENEVVKALKASGGWGLVADVLRNAESASDSAESASDSAEEARKLLAEMEDAAADTVSVMTILDRKMFEKFGGTYNGVTYDNPDYYFSPTNWEVLLRCNRAYVQAYDADNDLRLGEDGKGLYCLMALLRYGGIAFTSSEGIAVDVQVPRYPWMRKDKWVETYRAQNPDSELSDEEIMTDYPPAWTDYPFMSTICERRPDGRIRIPRTFAGLTDEQARQLAAPKDYVDAKAAEAVEKAVKSANEYTNENAAPKLNPDSGNTYAYCYNGAGIELPIIIGANTPLPDSIVRRNSNGVVITATSGEATDAVNVSWAKSHFVANLVGENASNRYVYTSYNGVPKLFLLTKNPSATAGDTIPFRRPNGRLGVGSPEEDTDAVNLQYFNSHLPSGGKIYQHEVWVYIVTEYSYFTLNYVYYSSSSVVQNKSLANLISNNTIIENTLTHDSYITGINGDYCDQIMYASFSSNYGLYYGVNGGGSVIEDTLDYSNITSSNVSETVTEV
ncbi:MAG: BppU family phage baseplate upper protein [Clostridia bacterium]|nr:BppU family phage baseplate upper protein [Clostridia bacterium]